MWLARAAIYHLDCYTWTDTWEKINFLYTAVISLATSGAICHVSMGGSSGGSGMVLGVSGLGQGKRCSKSKGP